MKDGMLKMINMATCLKWELSTQQKSPVSAIELAASIAALLLTTEAIITEEAEEKLLRPAMSGADY